MIKSSFSIFLKYWIRSEQRRHGGIKYYRPILRAASGEHRGTKISNNVLFEAISAIRLS